MGHGDCVQLDLYNQTYTRHNACDISTLRRFVFRDHIYVYIYPIIKRSYTRLDRNYISHSDKPDPVIFL